MSWFSLCKYKWLKKKKPHLIYHMYATQEKLTSLNSPIVCFMPDVLHQHIKEDQVFNYM